MADFRFDSETHTYWLGDQKLPSVTQILKEAGLIDTSRYSEGSAQFGTNVHLACELDDKGELDEGDLAEEYQGYLVGWRKFRRQTQWTPDGIEKRCFSKKLLYAGTIDRVAFSGKGLVVIDIKSGQPQPWAALQLAGYAEMLDESFPGPARWVIQLFPDGRFKIHEYKNHREDRQTFLAALTVANWKRGH